MHVCDAQTDRRTREFQRCGVFHHAAGPDFAITVLVNLEPRLGLSRGRSIVFAEYGFDVPVTVKHTLDQDFGLDDAIKNQVIARYPDAQT